MWLDISHNHTLADEAMLIGTILTFIAGVFGTLAKIRSSQKHIAIRVDRIDSTLNHVNEPEPAEGPTIGQRVAKIDARVDRLDHKLDRIGDNLSDLTGRMMDHIRDEQRRTERLEDKVQQLDRRKDWGTDG